MGPEKERLEARKKGKKRYQSAGIPSKVEAPVEVDERPKPWELRTGRRTSGQKSRYSSDFVRK